MGNDVLPGFYSGRSATRKRGPSLLLKRSRRGQRTFHFHSTMLGRVGRLQNGVFSKAFCDVRHAPSFNFRMHDDMLIVRFPRAIVSLSGVSTTIFAVSDGRVMRARRRRSLEEVIAYGVVNIPRL
jgi:hypothetical protein